MRFRCRFCYEKEVFHSVLFLWSLRWAKYVHNVHHSFHDGRKHTKTVEYGGWTTAALDVLLCIFYPNDNSNDIDYWLRYLQRKFSLLFSILSYPEGREGSSAKVLSYQKCFELMCCLVGASFQCLKACKTTLSFLEVKLILTLCDPLYEFFIIIHWKEKYAQEP